MPNLDLPKEKGTYFTQRTMAFGLDIFLAHIFQTLGAYLGGVVAGIMVSKKDLPIEALEGAIESGVVLGWVFWGAVAWFLNYGILQGLSGSSLGKKLFKLKVVDFQGQPLGMARSIIRAFCYHLSAAPFFAGFFFAFWQKEGRGWHDLLCQSFVTSTQIKESPVIALPAPDSQALDSEQKAA